MNTIATPEKVKDGVYIIDELPLVSELQAYSVGQPGNYGLSDISVSHSVGSHATYYLLRSSAALQMENARRVAKLTGLEETYSYASQSRRILKWLNWNAPYDSQMRENLRVALDPFHFQHCRAWMACPQITMYDLKSAYWQMVKRMPSPLVQIKGTHDAPRVVFHPIYDAERQKKWKQVVNLIDKSEKMFRLVFVGCCLSGLLSDKWNSFHDGKRMPVPIELAALVGMAALAVRSTYEVTMLQARALESRYANADCCTSETDARPELWDALGLVYETRASGRGDIRQVGAYKIGDYETDNYAPLAETKRWRNTEGVDVPALYHKSFLT